MPEPISDRKACARFGFTPAWLKKHRRDDDPPLPTCYKVAGKNHRDLTGPVGWEGYFKALRIQAAMKAARERPEQPIKRGRGRPRKYPRPEDRAAAA